MELNIKFANPQQEAFYYTRARNACFSGGFNNGKSFGACLKMFSMLNMFPNSQGVIARQVYSDLKATTMKTFSKICPPELIERNNFQDGLTILKNGSQIKWMHLKDVEESTLRGLEMNFCLVDQAEEIEEKLYDILEARIGRWDKAIVPQALKDANGGTWPRNAQGGDVVPSYIWLLCNPDTQFHFIYRKYHPDSLEREPKNFFVEGEWDPTLGSSESYQIAIRKGEEYVAKYIRGQWGLSDTQIHRVQSASLLDYDRDLVDKILRKGNLFRILDHGDASPTSCLWFAALGGVYICYREYYVPGRTISYHRQAIAELSGDEVYSANWADPQIFKKTSQKDGGFWTVSMEYLSNDVDGPKLQWAPADNNEFATRNRINELLRGGGTNPVSGEEGNPRLYFIKKSPEYPNGCFHAISETQSQRRAMLGYVDGKTMYSDDRQESIADHAYDCVRYFVAMHGLTKKAPRPRVKPMSMDWFRMMKKRGENRPAAALSS